MRNVVSSFRFQKDSVLKKIIGQNIQKLLVFAVFFCCFFALLQLVSLIDSLIHYPNSANIIHPVSVWVSSVIEYNSLKEDTPGLAVWLRYFVCFQSLQSFFFKFMQDQTGQVSGHFYPLLSEQIIRRVPPQLGYSNIDITSEQNVSSCFDAQNTLEFCFSKKHMLTP